MFILVNTLVYSTYPLPDRETTCGILVLPVVNGAHLLLYGTGVSIALMAAGTYLFYKKERPNLPSRSLMFMVIMTVLAMILGFIGWLPGLILNVMLILMLIIRPGALLIQENVT